MFDKSSHKAHINLLAPTIKFIIGVNFPMNAYSCVYNMIFYICLNVCNTIKASTSNEFYFVLVQKISPDAKEKIQLQVVLHTSGANTFHFTNPAGREAQKVDREAVKELLQQLLPKFRSKISGELEEKNRFVRLQIET